METLSNVAPPGSKAIPSAKETRQNLTRISGNPRQSATELGQETLQTAAKYDQLTTSQKYLNSVMRRDLELQLPRRWFPGDVYAPHDLTGAETRKWKRTNNRPNRDAFDLAGINPLKEYKNFSIMSEYMTEMGRIKPRTETGLRPVNQRRLSKAIARAIGMGIMPSVHRHPQLLEIAKSNTNK